MSEQKNMFAITRVRSKRLRMVKADTFGHKYITIVTGYTLLPNPKYPEFAEYYMCVYILIYRQ